MKQSIQQSNLLSIDTILLLFSYAGSAGLFLTGVTFLNYQALIGSGVFLLALAGIVAAAASVCWIKN
jgi:hypothetical protein